MPSSWFPTSHFLIATIPILVVVILSDFAPWLPPPKDAHFGCLRKIAAPQNSAFGGGEWPPFSRDKKRDVSVYPGHLQGLLISLCGVYCLLVWLVVSLSGRPWA